MKKKIFWISIFMVLVLIDNYPQEISGNSPLYRINLFPDPLEIPSATRGEGANEPVINISPGNYYALLIGVSTYEDFPNIRPLPSIPGEIMQLQKVLVTKYTFEETKVKTLIDPTRKQIIREFEAFRGIIQPGDNLLIFFAGHGKWQAAEEEGYWWAKDSEKEHSDNWLPNSTIRDKIRSIKCQHILLIADACFGGSFFIERGEEDKELKDIKELYNLKSRRAITSGAANEPVPGKSVFIEFLIEKLYTNRDLYITSRALCNYIQPKVIKTLGNVVPQDGKIVGVDDNGGDFIFIKRK